MLDKISSKREFQAQPSLSIASSFKNPAVQSYSFHSDSVSYSSDGKYLFHNYNNETEALNDYFVLFEKNVVTRLNNCSKGAVVRYLQEHYGENIHCIYLQLLNRQQNDIQRSFESLCVTYILCNQAVYYVYDDLDKLNFDYNLLDERGGIISVPCFDDTSDEEDKKEAESANEPEVVSRPQSNPQYVQLNQVNQNIPS